VSPLSLDDWTLDDWKGDASLPVFAPERRDPEMRYLGLRCPCGGWIFRLTGWPRLAAGEGGYLLRTLVRVWREARQPMDAGEPEESPFLLPVQLECERCGRKGPLFEAPDRPDRVGPAGRAQPREAYRCRACRRGRIALVIGVAGVVAPGDPGGGATRRESEAASREGRGAAAAGVGEAADAVELIARCEACRRQARIAWSDARPSPQERRLDLLYGRS